MTDRGRTVIVCEGCGAEIDPRGKGIVQQVVGWSGRRSGGGIHQITEARWIGRYAHRACLPEVAGYVQEVLL